MYYGYGGKLVGFEARHAGPPAVAYNSTNDGGSGNGVLQPPDPSTGGSVRLSYAVGITARCQTWSSTADGWIADGTPIKCESERAVFRPTKTGLARL